MKKTSETLVFFGSGPVAAASLRFLKNHFDIEAVITKPATQSEMASLNATSPVLSVINAQQLNDLIREKQFQSKVGVIVDFGIIVDQSVIDYFPLGIVNAHFSLLPRWRGADPITFAILEGDQKTGVSLMLIKKQLDTGKLIAQKSLPIEANDTSTSLTNKLIELSNQMLANYLPKFINDLLKPKEQPHPSRSTYSRKLTKDDGNIDWQKSAEQIEREIRAYKDWPKSRTKLAGKEVIITKAYVVPVNHPGKKPGDTDIIEGLIMVDCGEGTLCIEKLKPAGKKEMSSAEFTRGYLR